MTISAPLIGSADMTALLLLAPRRGAHRSQPDLSGQPGLTDKPARKTQRFSRKGLRDAEIGGGLMAKPRHLTLGVAPGGTLRRRNHLRERHLAAQMAQELRQPDRLHRRK